MIVAPSLDAKAQVQAFQQKHQISYPLAIAARKDSEAYKVEAYPTMFLVGKDRVIIWKGHFSNPDLEKALQKALKP